MIFGTYVGLDHGVGMDDELSVDNSSLLNRHIYPSMELGTMDFLERLEKTKSSALRYAVIFHAKQDIGGEKEVIVLRSEDKSSFRRRRAVNPYYRLDSIKRKNVALLWKKPSEKASMHQRMLQLLLLSNATKDVLGKYDLGDPYQDSLYSFQREHFKEESDMSLIQALSFCRNVLSYLRLGWITINFLDDSPSAYFQVEHDKLRKADDDNGGSFAPSNDDEFDENKVPVKEHMIDVMALPDQPIEMTKLSLNIPVTWALNKALLLHEISHYCVFMMPMTIEFYRDRDEYEETAFEKVFSSHGKLFNSIFAHLLSRFCYIDFDDVYVAMEQQGAPLYSLDKFSESRLYKFIHEDLN